MKPELVLSKQPGNSDGNETTTTNNNLMAVLPEMSEIQGLKILKTLARVKNRFYRNCKKQLFNSLCEQQNQFDVCASNYLETT